MKEIAVSLSAYSWVSWVPLVAGTLGGVGYLASYLNIRRFGLWATVVVIIGGLVLWLQQQARREGYRRRQAEEARHALETIRRLREVRIHHRNADYGDDSRELRDDDGFRRD